MRIVIFCHSLVSDWNHGNAHFLRGVVSELDSRGHQVSVYEPADGWSRAHLVAEHGPGPLRRFEEAFPLLRPMAVDLDALDLDEALDGADLVLVHEWSPHALVERLGRHRLSGGRYTLLFHDSHHRSVTDVDAMAAYRLEHYDGVLAFGEVIRDRYVRCGWSRRAWTWHEAADVRTFHPLPSITSERDVIWIGNWGDEERSEELRSYLMAPVRALRLSATVHGVRYPDAALRELSEAGVTYGGWLANYDAPRAYAAHHMTVHVPRRPYLECLPGVPTVRMFEALACGVPLVSRSWPDVEHLFTAGADYLVAESPARMQAHLRDLREDPDLRREVAAHGLATVRARHTCAHRVDQLMDIARQLRHVAPTAEIVTS